MTKYRTLTSEELPLFEQEFKEYLAINGIDADMWVKLKEEEPDKAEKIIDVFADVVFNTVLMKVKYIEHISENSLKYFRYDTDQAILIGIDGEGVDFSNKESILRAVDDTSHKIEFFTTTKKYTQKREEEIFQMLKNGCSISDGSMFERLLELAKEI